MAEKLNRVGQVNVSDLQLVKWAVKAIRSNAAERTCIFGAEMTSLIWDAKKKGIEYDCFAPYRLLELT